MNSNIIKISPSANVYEIHSKSTSTHSLWVAHMHTRTDNTQWRVIDDKLISIENRLAMCVRII